MTTATQTPLTPTSTAALEPLVLLSIKEVGAKLGGLNRSRVYSLMRDNGFPRALKLGAKTVRWRNADVEAWLHQQALAQGLEAHA